MADLMDELRCILRAGGLATHAEQDALLARYRRVVLEEAARVAQDDDGAFTHWGEDRNTATSQQTARDIAAAILALIPQEPPHG